MLSTPPDQKKVKILQLFIIRVVDHRFKLEQKIGTESPCAGSILVRFGPIHWSNNTLDRTISPIKIEAIFSLRKKIVWQLFPYTVPKIFEAVTDYLNDVGKNACLFMDWSKNSNDCDELTRNNLEDIYIYSIYTSKDKLYTFQEHTKQTVSSWFIFSWFILKVVTSYDISNV